MKILHVVLKKKNVYYDKKATNSSSLSVSQLQNPDYWRIVEGQFGDMLVGQDGDIMLEASTWKRIQEKLNGKLTISSFMKLFFT